MIEINVIRYEDDIRSVIATGHATKGTKAPQICSGVSALMYTLALNLRETNRVTVNVIDDKNGMCIDIIRGHKKAETRIITKTVVRGLKSIADLYPHSLRIRFN